MSFLMNWKTTAAGAGTLVLFALQQFGLNIPGVPIMDGQTLLVAFGLMFARDQSAAAKK